MRAAGLAGGLRSGGGVMVMSLPGPSLVWDNLNTRAQAEKLALASRSWLRTYRLPPYAPDLNPVEGIWSVLKRGPLANLSCPVFDDLVQVIQHSLRAIQRRPRLIEGLCVPRISSTALTSADEYSAPTASEQTWSKHRCGKV
jgi:hypothetical protein